MKQKNKYTTAVKSILYESGGTSLDYIREIRSSVEPGIDQIFEQKLLSYRLALKSGNFDFSIDDLNPAAIQSIEIKAEVYFVLGMTQIYKALWSAALVSFEEAAPLYLQGQNYEKHLLSRFNYFIVQDQIMPYSSGESLHRLNLILKDAKEYGCAKISGLCLRQKSYVLFADGRLLAAIEVLEKNLEDLETSLPNSDFHFCLIHLADCYAELGNTEKSRVYLDFIPEKIDSRVEFPRAYVTSKLLGTSISLTDFKYISDYWLSRYKNQYRQTPKESKTIFWFTGRGLLLDDKMSIIARIKPDSKEGFLLQMLQASPRHKNEICEVLWPEFCDVAQQDQKFHRLLSRIQSKVNDLIEYNGGFYKLTAIVKSKK